MGMWEVREGAGRACGFLMGRTEGKWGCGAAWENTKAEVGRRAQWAALGPSGSCVTDGTAEGERGRL